MKRTAFLADSAAEALAQIRAELGPQAVVLNVRRVPAAGLAMLWQKPRVEVVAGVKEAAADVGPPMAGLLETIAQLNRQLPPIAGEDGERLARLLAASVRDGLKPGLQTGEVGVSSGSFADGLKPGLLTKPGLRAGTREVLQGIGLLPEFAQSLWEQLEEPGAPESRDELVAQLERARILLGHCWTEPEWKKAPLEGQSHVFVGAPGAGKTTCLSKWLAQAVLLGGRAARVYRLDGRTANTAEALSVHADILGAPVSRCWPTGPEGDGEAGELRLIDLPGFDPRDAGVMREMRERLRVWGNPVVHVVLNAAYETKLLLEQARAFGDWPGADLIFTHLDEQPEWGKLWNFVLGTKCPLGFLCAGQEVPGTFLEADPGRLWPENLEAALKQWDGKGSAETEKFV